MPPKFNPINQPHAKCHHITQTAPCHRRSPFALFRQPAHSAMCFCQFCSHRIVATETDSLHFRTLATGRCYRAAIYHHGHRRIPHTGQGHLNLILARVPQQLSANDLSFWGTLKRIVINSPNSTAWEWSSFEWFWAIESTIHFPWDSNTSSRERGISPPLTWPLGRGWLVWGAKQPQSCCRPD